MVEISVLHFSLQNVNTYKEHSFVTFWENSSCFLYFLLSPSCLSRFLFLPFFLTLFPSLIYSFSFFLSQYFFLWLYRKRTWLELHVFWPKFYIRLNFSSRWNIWFFSPSLPIAGACPCRLVTKSRPTLWPHGLQYARLPCLPLSLGVRSNSCPLSWWC